MAGAGDFREILGVRRNNAQNTLLFPTKFAPSSDLCGLLLGP